MREEAPIQNQVPTVELRRTFAASPDRLFDAWTQPEQLLRWWGPTDVKCVGAEVDLRPGGSYRLGNQLPDGSTIWIEGDYEVVDPPSRLVYTWRTDYEGSPNGSRVTVTFSPVTSGTELIVTHERIATTELRDNHEAGWLGCLDGLEEILFENG